MPKQADTFDFGSRVVKYVCNYIPLSSDMWLAWQGVTKGSRKNVRHLFKTSDAPDSDSSFIREKTSAAFRRY